MRRINHISTQAWSQNITRSRIVQWAEYYSFVGFSECFEIVGCIPSQLDEELYLWPCSRVHTDINLLAEVLV